MEYNKLEPINNPIIVSLNTQEENVLNVIESFEAALQINGRKIYGPPINWEGPPPSTPDCELFIKRLPRNINEVILLSHFLRFGQVYEFRLMMDFNECNRGFGFIKYTKKEDAQIAMEVMNHFFIQPGKLLKIQQSYDKNRLFVGNIPKTLTVAEVEKGILEEFPTVKNIVIHKRMNDVNENRGFAFIDFPNHQEALNVKRLTSPGRLHKWGTDLKVVWANPERSVEPCLAKDVKTLFVRNIDYTVNTREIFNILKPIVSRSQILKVSRVREFAFIDFNTKEAAETVLSKLQNFLLKGHRLSLEWALPPSTDSVHNLKHNDFDALLRLKCIANYWGTPVILYGRIYPDECIQQAAIMIKSSTQVHVFFFEVIVKGLSDIQSRICEALIGLINQHGGLPSYNYVIKIIYDMAHIVGIITELSTGQFFKSKYIPTAINIFIDGIVDLSCATHFISLYHDNDILNFYKETLEKFPDFPFIVKLFPKLRIVACIPPLNRKKPLFKFHSNSPQIIFVLCDLKTHTNYIYPESVPKISNCQDFQTTNDGPIYTFFNLLPLHFVRSKHHSSGEFVCFPLLTGNDKSLPIGFNNRN